MVAITDTILVKVLWKGVLDYGRCQGRLCTLGAGYLAGQTRYQLLMMILKYLSFSFLNFSSCSFS